MELPSVPLGQMVAVETADGRTMYLRGVVDGNSGGVKFTLCSGGGGGSGDGDVDENGLADYLHAKRWMKGMLQDHARNEKYQHAISAAVADWKREHGHAAVSYTHLTLPTKRIV